MTLARKRALINAFIAFHLVAVFAWCLPSSFAARRLVTDPIGRYMVGLGLWQGWDMFSPNPRTVNIRVGALVTYANGVEEPFDFPQMDRLGLFERYRMERWRKWVNDNMRLDKNPSLWTPAARWVADRRSGGPSPVRRVRLIRRWWDVPPPAPRGWLGRLEDPVRVEHEYVFYDWRPQEGS